MNLYPMMVRESEENVSLRRERDETRLWILRIGLAIGADCPDPIDGETVAQGWQRWRDAIEAKLTPGITGDTVRRVVPTRR